MANVYVEEKKFERENFIIKPLLVGTYEGCIFDNCTFEQANILNIKFIDCTFNHCNASMAKVGETVFTGCTFTDCKMQGIRFDECSRFGLSIQCSNCNLHLSSFYGSIIKKSVFNNCRLTEVDFTNCNALGVAFNNCDLNASLFNNCNLEQADFRTAVNFLINPENNRLKKAMFAMHNLSGLLHKYKIVIS